ncbi:MAG: amidohydrolase family protein [Dysosmobacter sp.]
MRSPAPSIAIAEESEALRASAPACATRSATGTGRKSACRPSRKTRTSSRDCEQQNSDMLAAMFGGHALFTISDKTFDRMVAANNGRTGYHIHVSEGMNDVYDSLQNYGRRPVQRLQDHGILGPKTILGHCIHVNTAEMEIIKETGTMVVNNPESNMGNAVGICPVLQLYKRGILLGLGTDAYTNDMLESLKGGPLLPAAQCLPAQRGLVRGHGYALQEQRQDRRAYFGDAAGRAEARRRGGRDRHGLQALHAVLR